MNLFRRAALETRMDNQEFVTRASEFQGGCKDKVVIIFQTKPLKSSPFSNTITHQQARYALFLKMVKIYILFQPKFKHRTLGAAHTCTYKAYGRSPSPHLCHLPPQGSMRHIRCMSVSQEPMTSSICPCTIKSSLKSVRLAPS